ncbi:DUF1192 domain-containing protein [Pararhizobium antarcticum]|uniref:DUF1192 domain-containing protein n=1 Tax=Pararhizobium antarcticum TaxID=1798805 RepID=A0A657LRL6_9HYPH|nr:DUF1192 domain-containing protein [Pararhizobium antarcticum]OJF94538.1 hypothetical protein AX760_20045 [Pararhizobium antarcticum]OJF96680.1 hypothetical protein AX761_03725 [Rhizobium sp. 58]
MTLFEDDRPKKAVAHEIGCDLSLLSAEDLSTRIDLMKAEITRLESERQSKLASRSAAESIFR